MANPPSYGYWTMFGGPDPDPDPDPAAILPTTAGLYTTPPDPVYHSVITGTFDPTPEEIVVAAVVAGTPVPPGVDRVEFSRMMSGLPPTPASLSTSSISMPLSPSSSPSLPSGGASSGVSGSPITAAMEALSPSFAGGGGILCDPITGKCPQYR